MSEPMTWRYEDMPDGGKGVIVGDGQDADAYIADVYDPEFGPVLAASPKLLKALQDAPEPPVHRGSATWESYATRCANWYTGVRTEALKAAGGGK